MLDWATVSPPAPNDDTLLERATHDLLNPVASILGLSETIRERGADLGDAVLKQFGESISRQSARLEAGVRDLIRATRLQRRDPGVAAQRVALVDVLGGTGSERVRTELEPDAHVQADPVLLADVVRRLLENALDYSTGDVVVRGGPGWIEVADEGVGFTPEGLDRAFEPLSAGANAKAERGPGLGLGLYIARRLVEAMNGKLTATSEAGKGSAFRISLPV